MKIDLDEKIIKDLKYLLHIYIILLEEEGEETNEPDYGLISMAKDCELALIKIQYELPSREIPLDKL